MFFSTPDDCTQFVHETNGRVKYIWTVKWYKIVHSFSEYLYVIRIESSRQLWLTIFWKFSFYIEVWDLYNQRCTKMNPFNFPHSLKNIPLPSQMQYRRTLVSSIEKFVTRLRVDLIHRKNKTNGQIHMIFSHRFYDY